MSFSFNQNVNMKNIQAHGGRYGDAIWSHLQIQPQSLLNRKHTLAGLLGFHVHEITN